MRTRTLLLLAVTCGLAILIAGTVQILRLAGQDTQPILAMGDTGTAGDARVTVTAFDETDGVATVTVTLSGVDDPAGLAGFTLVGPGATAEPNQHGPEVCTGITVAPVTCTLTFGTADVQPGDRLLVFHRAAESARWKLV
ncbi:MAG: hypothetical protein RJA49_370 [Actinomycetota bacterium]